MGRSAKRGSSVRRTASVAKNVQHLHEQHRLQILAERGQRECYDKGDYPSDAEEDESTMSHPSVPGPAPAHVQECGVADDQPI